MHYREWGGSGRPIVLVHGLASTSHIWDLVAPILSRRFAVVALDLRGHGETDKPNSGYDFVTVAADVHGFLATVGLSRPALVGHSWGGNVIVELAATHPDLAGGLFLLDGGTIEISAAQGMTLERARKEMAPPDLSGMKLESLRELARSRDWGFPLTPEIEEMMLASFEVLEDGTVRVRFRRENHMAVIDAFWGHRPSALYPRITCPVLLMPARGRGDEASEDWRHRKEESVQRAERLLPDSRTVWLEDSVHDAPLQRPELVAKVIERQMDERLAAAGVD
jgi:pimeloyl-ACP methyl ester carboxylesterase